ADAVRSLFRRVLTIQEQTLGPDHPELAPNLLGIAGVSLIAKGALFDVAEEERLILRGLATREKAFGMEHPFVVETLEGLADFYQDQAPLKYKEVSVRQRILAIQEKTLGPNQTAMVYSLSKLALAYISQHMYAEAARLLDIREKTLGPDHPAVVYSLGEMAW